MGYVLELKAVNELGLVVQGVTPSVAVEYSVSYAPDHSKDMVESGTLHATDKTYVSLITDGYDKRVVYSRYRAAITNSLGTVYSDWIDFDPVQLVDKEETVFVGAGTQPDSYVARRAPLLVPYLFDGDEDTLYNSNSAMGTAPPDDTYFELTVATPFVLTAVGFTGRNNALSDYIPVTWKAYAWVDAAWVEVQDVVRYPATVYEDHYSADTTKHILSDKWKISVSETSLDGTGTHMLASEMRLYGTTTRRTI